MGVNQLAKTGIAVGGVVAVMLVSFGIGAGSTSARTVEKTVEKQVTPDACLLYINLSEEGFGYVSDAIGHAQQILQGNMTRDVSIIREANDGLDVVNVQLDRLLPKINNAKTECRGQA